MDRRQRHLLTGGFVAAASLLLADVAVKAAPGEAPPQPSASSPSAAVSPAAVSATPSPPPKASASPKPAAASTPVPVRLPPAAPPSPIPRPAAVAGKNNPRPWEWSQWSQEDQTPDRTVERIVPPLALRTPEVKGADNEDSATVQRLIEHLPGEERAVFLRNFKRWAQLTMEERQTLRRQADERHQRMQQEMDGALRESGLHLDEDRREMFTLRYGQERRRLERELQEKVAAERARRSPEIIQRLRREFEQVSSPAPSATASAGTPTGQTPTPRP